MQRRDEELPQLDLSDIELNNIAEEITVDQYYELGVSLGFNIHQLDTLQYNRFRNRKQAIYDMLVRWRKGQRDGQEAKRQLLLLTKSVGTPVDQKDMQGSYFCFLIVHRYPSSILGQNHIQSDVLMSTINA